jgi:hypothetical protein
MYKIALAAAAAAALALPSSFVNKAAAGWHGDVRYVPAVYCNYKSQEYITKNIAMCPDPFVPLGWSALKWRTNYGAMMCWNTYGFGGKEYTGYWAPCPK